jgi:hypothetical protein
MEHMVDRPETECPSTNAPAHTTPGRRATQWRARPSKQEMLALPSFVSLPPQRILLADAPARVAQAAALLSVYTVLGFDSESRPVFQAGGSASGPHLIQLASEDAVVLFPIDREVPRVLREILENERIRKVGFGLGSDRQRLAATFGIRLRGGQELSGLVQALGFRQRVGLQTAVAVVLGCHLRKVKRITTSNWAARPLSPAQIAYAADDALSRRPDPRPADAKALP